MTDITARKDGDRRIVSGIAIPFNENSVDLGGFLEQFAPSAVEYTLRRGVDVRALSGHDSVRLLGRVTARTLAITKDARGLRYELDLPDTSDGRDVFELVRRRDLTGASFAFSIRDSGEVWDFSGRLPLRTITDSLIREISLVAWPAYPTTTASVSNTRSQRPAARSLAWLEKWHRNQLAR